MNKQQISTEVSKEETLFFLAANLLNIYKEGKATDAMGIIQLDKLKDTINTTIDQITDGVNNYLGVEEKDKEQPKQPDTKNTEKGKVIPFKPKEGSVSPAKKENQPAPLPISKEEIKLDVKKTPEQEKSNQTALLIKQNSLLEKYLIDNEVEEAIDIELIVDDFVAAGGKKEDFLPRLKAVSKTLIGKKAKEFGKNIDRLKNFRLNIESIILAFEPENAEELGEENSAAEDTQNQKNNAPAAASESGSTGTKQQQDIAQNELIDDNPVVVDAETDIAEEIDNMDENEVNLLSPEALEKALDQDLGANSEVVDIIISATQNGQSDVNQEDRIKIRSIMTGKDTSSETIKKLFEQKTDHKEIFKLIGKSITRLFKECLTDVKQDSPKTVSPNIPEETKAKTKVVTETDIAEAIDNEEGVIETTSTENSPATPTTELTEAEIAEFLKVGDLNTFREKVVKYSKSLGKNLNSDWEKVSKRLFNLTSKFGAAHKNKYGNFAIGDRAPSIVKNFIEGTLKKYLDLDVKVDLTKIKS